MNIERFREYCLKKKSVTKEFPFDETTLVFKVIGKMFTIRKAFSFIHHQSLPLSPQPVYHVMGPDAYIAL